MWCDYADVVDQPISPTTPLVLAVDAGGTSCRAAVITADGACLGVGLAGAANPVGSGVEDAVAQLVQCVRQAISSDEVDPSHVQLVLVGAAGGDTHPGFGEALEAALAAVGITAPVRLEADAQAAFCSGTAAPSGYVLVAGTGAVALRVADGKLVRVADGSGWLLGDVGSGFWVGQQVVRDVLAALDGRGPVTAMSPDLLTALGVPLDAMEVGPKGRPVAVGRMEEAIYALRPTDLARFARLAFLHAGDRVADAIILAAAEGLATTLSAALDPAVPGPVVVAGGLLANPTGLREVLEGVLARRGLPQELVPASDGLVGAAVMALRATGVLVDDDLHARLTQGIAARRARPSPA